MTDYETVIGLEVHAQLLSATKLFCGCSTQFGDAPNSHTCPVCLGLPGSLPVTNEQAVRLAVRAGLALSCEVHERSIFARKNYFYPDLPKGYQVSQYEEPIATAGHLDIEVDGEAFRIGITRAHMEEDAGKNVHGVGGDSVVDLNRTGTPLLEIVSEPDLRSSAQAVAYLKALREILMAVGVNDGNLEEGSFRCDANVSIRPRGATKLGTRCELKNLNSFRFVQRAIEVEVARQSAILDAGGAVVQETRSFDPDAGVTRTLRSKEEAHDYRYFPEPDLPPLRVSAALRAEEAAKVGELPAATRRRWKEELGLGKEAIGTLSQHPAYVRFFEQARAACSHPIKLANWIQTEVLRSVQLDGLGATFSVTPAQVAGLVEMVEAGKISGKQAKDVYAALETTQESAEQVVARLGLQVVSDSAELEPLVRGVLAQFPEQVAQVRGGKQGVIGFLVGQVMKQSKGKAEPRRVNEILTRLLQEVP